MHTCGTIATEPSVCVPIDEVELLKVNFKIAKLLKFSARGHFVGDDLFIKVLSFPGSR